MGLQDRLFWRKVVGKQRSAGRDAAAAAASDDDDDDDDDKRQAS